MAVIFVILLIVAGIALIVVEVVVLPGVTVAGVGGVILIGAGVYFSFGIFGQTVGIFVLISASLLFIFFLIYALRARTWDRLSLHSEIDGKVNVITDDIHIGDTAVTISRLAPMGKILIHGKMVEAKSEIGMIDEKKTVKVVQANQFSVIVREEES
ncbi:MAG: hypothetical protein LBS03_04560 [Bacteroidales bacterium]|jgi:membrane-bound ClpP family serine protease|nr:hypothetical protein [Bacteroidales bacterium]